jgi:hypothetical protein
MENVFDAKSFLGSISTIFFAFIGTHTYAEWAAIMAIVTGVLTSIYTFYKLVRDIKRDYSKKRK